MKLEKEFDFDIYQDLIDRGVDYVTRELKLSEQAVGAWFESRRAKYYSDDRSALDARRSFLPLVSDFKSKMAKNFHFLTCRREEYRI